MMIKVYWLLCAVLGKIIAVEIKVKPKTPEQRTEKMNEVLCNNVVQALLKDLNKMKLTKKMDVTTQVNLVSKPLMGGHSRLKQVVLDRLHKIREKQSDDLLAMQHGFHERPSIVIHVVKKRPLADKGLGWGLWSMWSPCSVSRGQGFKERSRKKLLAHKKHHITEVERRICRVIPRPQFQSSLLTKILEFFHI